MAPDPSVWDNGSPKSTPIEAWCATARAGATTLGLLWFGFIQGLAATAFTAMYAAKEIETVGRLVGKVEAPRSSLAPQQCMICYEHSTVYSALGCGHTFCNECYSTFLEHKIADEGHACIFARCPHGECNLLVTDQMVRSLLPEGERLQQWGRAALLERSFVDENPNIKWCPASDCTCAVKASKGHWLGSGLGLAS